MAGRNLGDLIVKIDGDNTGLDKSIDSSESKLTSFGNKAVKVGGKLTKFVTAPLLGIGAAFVALADKQLQAEAALTNAIRATGKEAEINVETLKEYASELQDVTTYGDEAQLSALALVQQLGNLNEDGLKQVLPSLLDFSAAMGVDLQTAASLVGKTLGSSTNALSRYGIEIDATAGPTEKLAQLTAAMDEKFSGAAKTAAETGLGGLKQLKNSAGDLAEEFGTLLLPALNDLVDTLREGIKWFSELSEGSKKLILTVAGIAAAAGPAISAIGGISKAMSFLAANPVIAVIAGVAAITAGIVAMASASNQARIEELTEKFGDLGEAAGLAGAELEAFVDQSGRIEDSFARMGAMGETSLEAVAKQAKYLAGELGVSESTVLEIGLRTETLSDAMRENLKILKEQAVAVEQRSENLSKYEQLQQQEGETMRQLQEDAAKIAGERARAEKEAAQALADQLKLIKEQVKERKITAYAAFIEQQRILNTEISVGLIAEEDRATILQREIANRKDYINAVIKEGEITREQFNGHIEALEALETEYDVLINRQQLVAEGPDIPMEAPIEEATEAAIELNDTLDDTISKYIELGQTITGYLSPVLEEIGAQLVAQEFSWESVEKVAVLAISDIIRALAEQAAVQAAVAFATGNIAGGVALAAASAVGFVAAGAVSAYGNSIGQEKPPDIVERTESGVETRPQTEVQAEPENFTLRIDMDSKPILEKIYEGSINGDVLVSTKAVV